MIYRLLLGLDDIMIRVSDIVHYILVSGIIPDAEDVYGVSGWT